MTISKEAMSVAHREKNDAKEAFNFVEGIDLNSNEDLDSFVSATALLKEHHKKVDNKRKSFVDPLKKVIRDIDSFFKEPLDTLKKAEYQAKEKMREFVENRLSERDKLLSQVQNADKKTQTTLIKKANDITPPKVAGLSIRKSYKGIVTNKDLLINALHKANMLNCLKVDEKALFAYSKENLNLDIPGWKLEEVSTVAITPSKTKEN